MKHDTSRKISWLCAGLLLLQITRLPAQVSTWTGASGGEWNTAASWSLGVPGPGTNALLNGGSTVNYNLPMLAAGLGTLTNNGILNVNNNGFNSAGIIMLNPGGSSSNGRLLLKPARRSRWPGIWGIARIRLCPWRRVLPSPLAAH